MYQKILFTLFLVLLLSNKLHGMDGILSKGYEWAKESKLLYCVYSIGGATVLSHPRYCMCWNRGGHMIVLKCEKGKKRAKKYNGRKSTKAVIHSECTEIRFNNKLDEYVLHLWAEVRSGRKFFEPV